jgi:hypothetical protein
MGSVACATAARRNRWRKAKHSSGRSSPKVKNTPPAKQLTSDMSQPAWTVIFMQTGTSTPIRPSRNSTPAAVHLSQV